MHQRLGYSEYDMMSINQFKKNAEIKKSLVRGLISLHLYTMEHKQDITVPSSKYIFFGSGIFILSITYY